jgi:hypothetical protein
MAATRRRTFWRRLRHKLCVAGALSAYLAASFGFPLPAPARAKPGGQPFPCQDNPCGCQTAEQCWTHCCCLTPEQHWEWARRHNVEPPAYATRPASQGWRSTPLRALEESAAAPETACACAAEGAPAKACCGDGQGDCCRPAPAEPAREAPPPAEGKTHWALGISALRCQGQSGLWVGGGAVLPPPAPAAWAPDQAPAAWVIPTGPPVPSVFTSPPTPPPRPVRA